MVREINTKEKWKPVDMGVCVSGRGYRVQSVGLERRPGKEMRRRKRRERVCVENREVHEPVDNLEKRE